MTPLSPSRIHELDLCSYLRSLFNIFHDYDVALEAVYKYYNRYLDDHGKPGISYSTIEYILTYDWAERWEWVTYYATKGLNAKQIAQIMGITPRTVYNTMAHKYRQNPRTLQRWLIECEVKQDMYGLQQATSPQQLTVPSRDVASLLRQSL